MARVIKEKFKAILKACDEEARLSGAPDSVSIIESKAGVKSLPADLHEYFHSCIPSSSAGRFPVYEPIEFILDSFDNDPVADHILSLGFVSFANGRDGGQFAYCLDDGKIYSFGVESVDAGNSKAIKKMAMEVWPSLANFLDWNLEQIKLG